jgi:hypothetical protein
MATSPLEQIVLELIQEVSSLRILTNSILRSLHIADPLLEELINEEYNLEMAEHALEIDRQVKQRLEENKEKVYQIDSYVIKSNGN